MKQIQHRFRICGRSRTSILRECSEVPAPRNPRSGSCRPERAPRWQPAAQASPHEVCAVPRGLCHPTEARWPLQLLQLLQRLHLPRLLRL